MIEITITILLVLLNGFFVAAEFALVKIRSSQLELLASAGKGRAKLALGILKNLDAYLSATQLGITLASLGLGAIGEPYIEELVKALFERFGLVENGEHGQFIHYLSIVLSMGILTTLHIVFGEQAPKMLAIQRSESVTLSVAYPMRLFYFLFKPVIMALNNFSNFILKLMGIKVIPGHDIHSAEELELLIDQGKATGAIEDDEHELIKNVFNFNQTTVRQVMVPRTYINAIDLDASQDEIVQKIISDGYSRMPVFKENMDNIEGVIYTKDVLKLIHSNRLSEFSSAIRPAYFVPETKKINDLLKDLQKKRMHMAIITDEFGGVSGIVTIEDIIEELVGEIQDEHDDEAPAVERVGELEFVVNAQASISDVNELLPEPLPEAGEYDTVAGYVNMIFGKIPELTDHTSTEDYEISIQKKAKQRVLSVKLKLIPRKAVEDQEE